MTKKLVSILLAVVLCCLMLSGCQKETEYAAEEANQTRFTVNSLAATDSLGRRIDPMNGTKERKYTGLFYFTHINNVSEPIYDITKILEKEDGLKQLADPNGTADAPMGATYFWGEPLFGYYNSEDEYVLRKHVELLTMANIDFLFLDATNTFTFDSVWRKLLPILDEYIQAGWKTPQVCFYLYGQTSISFNHLYDVLYSKNYYPDTWFKPNGKPLIIAKADDGAAGIGYMNGVSEEVRDFFEIKQGQWPHDALLENALPWIDLNYPQRDCDGAINVSVIQHPGMPISRSVFYEDDYAMYNSNYGRGYSHKDGMNDKSRILEGSNFEEQWEGVGIVEAMRGQEMEYIMITGWNEWMVDKLSGPLAPFVYFVDQMTYEFSRDIEMMKGGYGDNYYLQMIRNMRKYTKTGEYKPYKLKSPEKFGLYLSDKNWADYGVSFLDMRNDCNGRSSVGYSNQVYYEQAAAKNDIVQTKVLNDKNNLYIMVETEQDIKLNTEDTNCLNILLKTGGEKNWEGYDYIVNRFIKENGTTSLERATGNGFEFNKIADVEYAVAANRMVVKIPLKALGLKQKLTVEIKVTDSIENQADIMDYYVSGDSAPIGRFNYFYQNV